jgi:hypothetical protein
MQEFSDPSRPNHRQLSNDPTESTLMLDKVWRKLLRLSRNSQ